MSLNARPQPTGPDTAWVGYLKANGVKANTAGPILLVCMERGKWSSTGAYVLPREHRMAQQAQQAQQAQCMKGLREGHEAYAFEAKSLTEWLGSWEASAYKLEGKLCEAISEVVVFEHGPLTEEKENGSE